MQFYRVDGIAANEMWAEDTENCRATQEMARKINMLSDEFNRKLREKAYFFVTEANGAALTIGVSPAMRRSCAISLATISVRSA